MDKHPINPLLEEVLKKIGKEGREKIEPVINKIMSGELTFEEGQKLLENLVKSPNEEPIKKEISRLKENLFTKFNFKGTTTILSEWINKGELESKFKNKSKEMTEFIKRINLIFQKQKIILGLFMHLKEDKGLDSEEKIYLLVNVYRTLIEIIPKIFYEAILCIVKKIFQDDERSNYIQKIKSDELTIFDFITILEKYEEDNESHLISLMDNYLDREFRNKIAHESSIIQGNQFIYLNGKKIYSSKEILDKIIDANFLFTTFYNNFYEKDALKSIQEHPELFEFKPFPKTSQV